MPSRPAKATRSSPPAWSACRATGVSAAPGWTRWIPTIRCSRRRSSAPWRTRRPTGVAGSSARGPAAGHLHRDGSDGGERGHGPRHLPGRAGRVRRLVAAQVREGDGQRGLRGRDRAGDLARRHGGRPRRLSRPGTTLEGVAGLKPAFRPDGTITAGNCCPLNDGAAAVVIMSDRRAAELGLTPLARIVATGVSALGPEIMGLGPVEASRRALARAGLTTATSTWSRSTRPSPCR